MTRRVLAAAALTASALLVPLLASPAAAGVTSTVGSTHVSSAAVSALCATADVSASARSVPGPRRHADSPPVTAADLAAVTSAPAGTMRLQSQDRQVERALPARVVIPVHVTLVRGAQKRDTNRAPSAVRSWITLLNNAYAGKQSAAGAPTRFTFALSSVRQVKNDRWYHAVGNSRFDQQMRRKLHRGGAGTLNLYVTRPGRGGDLLGFARFPWQYAATPRQDGVTVNVGALPGGNIAPYNLGDTLVHEVGHWMGLFHTFQGECGDPARPTATGDLVEDTPAEALPNYTCPVGRDTCESDEGLDPVQNFMDYSWDRCMNQFTPRQVFRMEQSFTRFRLGR